MYFESLSWKSIKFELINYFFINVNNRVQDQQMF